MLKAIETQYNGYRFRSRLEARWAHFFNTLGVRYEYEKEGFDLPYGGKYLPDFWLPQQQCWIEIKAEKPTEEELIKAADLAFMTRKWVDIVWGNIGEQAIYAFRLPFYGFSYGHGYEFAICPECDQLCIAHIDNSGRYWSELYNLSISSGAFTHCYACGGGFYREIQSAKELPGSSRLFEAYMAARSARFEHGERGR